MNVAVYLDFGHRQTCLQPQVSFVVLFVVSVKIHQGSVLAIMTAVARLIAFQRIRKRKAVEFAEELRHGWMGSFAEAIPVVAMGMGVLSYIATMIMQASFIVSPASLYWCLAIVCVALVSWGVHEFALQRAKLRSHEAGPWLQGFYDMLCSGG